MRTVWIAAEAIVSPLGFTTRENYRQIMNGVCHMDTQCISRFASTDRVFTEGKTHFESLADKALAELRTQVSWPSKRTLFILSTTKGNIELLEKGHRDDPSLSLSGAAKSLANHAGIEDHLVVSNACTSGVAALLVARRYLLSGAYDHAVVLGADVISMFILSGFQSLLALSSEPCKPFDEARNGINLGEAAAAIYLTTDAASIKGKDHVAILGGGISNDANHISGPSKTGAELALAIGKAMKEAGASSGELGFISAHGTGTLYNDEMEAKAFNLAGMMDVPLHSLKGYVGHTLGAAGVLEVVMSAQSLKHQELIPSKGFNKSGVSMPLNVCTKKEKKHMRLALKTASGFGGTNAAIVLGIEL